MSRDWTEVQMEAFRYATRGMSNRERLSRDEQIVAGVTDERQRLERRARECVGCGGPRGSYPICAGCAGGREAA